ncbi:restriction endonuclease subunit S, partial [Enterococcus faecalis]
FGSALRRAELKSEGIPVYEQQNAIYNHRNFRYFIDEKKFEELRRFQVKTNDLIISCSGTVGRVSKIKENDEKGIISQALLTLRPDVEIINPDYLYYFFVSKEGRHSLLSRSSGSVQVNIAKRNIIENIPLPLPEKNIQQKIVDILNSLDSKIEVNNQIISNLEELASTLFKRWFVDFEFPDKNGNPYKSSGGKMVDNELGKIPEGWEATSLSDIANYKNGLAMQKFRPDENEKSLPVLKIKELNQGFTDSNSDRCSIDISDEVKIENGDVVFSWSGTLLVKIWTGGEAGLNQHLFKVTSNKFPKWYYYLWTKFYMNKFIGIAKDKVTTMGHIKRQHLSEAKVIIPSINMLEKFGKVLGPTIDMITEKGIENLELSNLRDSLLPKLLSGEIELPEDEEV